MTDILDRVGYPADLRRLPESDLPKVCEAVRQFIIEQVSEHPGHFASSLGAVELTVALHYVYNTPDDRIVWDVGHQAYPHKVLTGRRDAFATLRQKDGLCGFPSPKESPYDTFAAGHASNSISAALGMAVASHLEGSQRKVVAVIGDASISGGLAFEGLNNAASHPNDLLILLNDNQMAIDPNVGALYHYLTHITTSQRYNMLRYRAYRSLHKHGIVGDRLRRALIRFTNALKSLIARRQNIFEGLDIRYFGPIDGHDVVKLVHVLRKIKDYAGPKMLHICTVKGKGYQPAMDNATVWHAPGKFNPETGERIKEDTAGMPPKFQDVFGWTLVELAERDERVVGITPAMPSGCSMNYMMERYPERTFDVGIAEEHAVTFSGGLAKEGRIPFCNIYSAFMQRAVDEVIHDVALVGHHVVFCLDRAGIVGADGPTHHGAFDLAIFRAIPGMVVASPIDEHWLRRLMHTAAFAATGPFMIRYPRGRGSIGGSDAEGNALWRCPLEAVAIGRGYCVRPGDGDTAVLSLGPVGREVMRAIDLAEAGPEPASAADSQSPATLGPLTAGGAAVALTQSAVGSDAAAGSSVQGSSVEVQTAAMSAQGAVKAAASAPQSAQGAVKAVASATPSAQGSSEVGQAAAPLTQGSAPAGAGLRRGSVAHYDMVFCKPIDTGLLAEVFGRYRRVVTVEDGIRDGGFGSAVLEEANRQGYRGQVVRLGLPDGWVPQGPVEALWADCGIDARSIADVLRRPADMTTQC